MASKDYAHIQTDEELAALEKRIAEVYSDAASEMRATVNDYFDSYAQRYEQYIKEYNAGNITKEEFQQWELNQIGRGERYEAMANSLANRFVNADEVAMSYVNDATPSVYSLNRNYSNYAMNQIDPSIDFSLWDESTVRNLLVNQPNLMPYYPGYKAIKRGIDLNYGKEQIRKSVTSGILQGKSLSRIARDLMNRIQGMSLTSALRSARTAMTAAENAGRQDSYDEAADMGLKMEKVWLATLDSRTRTAHQQADFQVVKYNDMFDVGGESLMFPGDASHGASGWNLYNCRCTMFEKPEGMSMDDFERWARDPETGAKEKVTGESYEDWLKSKEQEANESTGGGILSSDEVVKKAQDYLNSGDYGNLVPAKSESDFEQIRKISNSKLGYDARPEVVSKADFDEMSKGQEVLYRGVHSSDDKSATDILNEFKYGDLWTGASGGALFGNGTYFSNSTDVANDYAQDSTGAVAKAYIKPDSKIANYDTVDNEHFDDIVCNDDYYGKDFTDLIGDTGQYSAFKGYDAIYCEKANGKDDYYVILNRGCLVMEE